MLDLSTAQQNVQSPDSGLVARVAPPTFTEEFQAAKEANDRLTGFDAAFRNQNDYLQDRISAFTAKTGVDLPALKYDGAPGDSAGDFGTAYTDWLGAVRDKMQDTADDRNDATLAPPSDQDIAAGGLEKARGALARQAAVAQAPIGLSSLLGSTAAGAYGMAKDPYNLISLSALSLAPEGAPLLAGIFRSAAAMGGQQLVKDVADYGYRRQVDPTYGVGDVASDVAGAAAGGALFGAGERLGGHGIRASLGAAAGGAIGGAALGAMQGGSLGALEGALGGAALPLAGAGVGLSARALGMSWRALVARSPDLAASMPLEVRDAGAVAEKAGDLQAQNPWRGPSGDAAHAEAIGAAEEALTNGKTFDLPPAAEAEAATRRGQVFYPGGSIDVRYGLAEHGDLVTSHDADFNVRPDYPPELQPRDRSSASSQDQVNTIAANLEPERLGPSPEANAGAPIVGSDYVVESGNGRALAIGQAYDQGMGGAYRAWLERQGYDTTGFDKPVLVGLRDTPLDAAGRADFAHAANGSASLRMSATEQALSDARLLDPGLVELARSPDLAAAANRDLARGFVAKLPQGERGGMLTRDGSLSAGGVQRVRAALAARAYGDPAFLARAFDHPDPNIKAIAGAMADAAGPWARMRDAATRGDIDPGHDITRDVLQAVHAVMRARDEGRPAWEMLNQGDMFQSDTTQLASRMFFRDEAMRQPAGRGRVAEALASYAEEAAKNTKAGRLFDDAAAPGDVLRNLIERVMPSSASDDFVLASLRKSGGSFLDDLQSQMDALIEKAEREPAPARAKTLEEQLNDLIKPFESKLREAVDAAREEEPATLKPGDVSYADEAPEDALDSSELNYGGEQETEYNGEPYMYDLDFVKDEGKLHAVLSDITFENEQGETVRAKDELTAVQFYKLKKHIVSGFDHDVLQETAEQLDEIDRYSRLTPEQQRAEDAAQQNAFEANRAAELQARRARIDRTVDDLVQTGWRPSVNRFGGWRRPEVLKEFASPTSMNMIDDRLLHHGIDIAGTAQRARDTDHEGFLPASLRRTPEELTAATDQAADDVSAMAREQGEDEPQQSIQDGIRQLVDLAGQPGHNHVRLPVGTTSSWLAETAAQHGLKIDGFEHQLDTSAIRHIVDRHGHPEEVARGGVRVTKEDIAALPDVMATPDKVVFGATNPRGQPLIVFVKAMPDGSTLVTEEVRARTLAVSSMRKYPATNDVLDNVALYVRNDGGAPLKVVDVPKGVNAIDGGDAAPRARPQSAGEPGAAPNPDLTLRNTRTGAEAQAQEAAPLAEMLKRHAAGASADPLLRAASLAIGGRLAKTIGDMKVFTVGRAEMRALAEGRMKIAPGMEPAGYFDPAADHIVMLDDALRDPREALQTLLHEGTHGFLMRTVDGSEAARNVIEHLRGLATAAQLERGGEAADHYGLGDGLSPRMAAHEFVAEARANPEFQRFLASIPADEQTAAAFGLDVAPGHSLWDVFVAAVRKILGLAPDQHTLLDASMRVGKLLDQMREAERRGPDNDLAPMLRPTEDAPPRTPEEQAAADRRFADVKDAINYRINADRIAQHPKGPIAGFLGILTRDIRDEGGINVESLQQDYEGRWAKAVEPILEAYGSKNAGLKQDVAGIRDVIYEEFGVDTKNETARAAAKAWKAGDAWATAEAKRLGKVFTPAEDWRFPQWWESSRAQKFGKTVLLADMEREIAAGGLKVYDPDTHAEANVLRQRAILDAAADKIVTDASLGGTHGGAFKSDMRVFRFAEGQAGADAYLRLMDKYGAGRGGYVQMMQAHVQKVSRELGMLRVLGPGWADVGERLKQDAILADKRIKANQPPRDLAQRASDLPSDAGKMAVSWLESPQKAEAVWQHMSGQASGVGSELMAGLMSGTRDFMTSTRMGSALVTAVPADTVNFLMASKHNGLPMGRMLSELVKTFVADTHERRELATRLGIATHAGIDAAIGTKRFEDQALGEGLMRRLSDFVIRAQGLHPWDAALKRVFPMEFLGTIGSQAGKAFAELEPGFANFFERYGLKDVWSTLSDPAHMLEVGASRYLHPDSLPEPVRVKLMSAIYDERQFAYLAGGTERVRAISAQAKAGTLPGELARSGLQFKNFSMAMLATWGLRSAAEAGAGRVAMLATLVTGMTMAGALAMQARSLLQGKDPRSMKDPYFWAESFLQGGAAGIYGDFFKEAFSRSDTSLTETMMGPLAAIPAGLQGLTSGARRMAEDGERVNFGAKLARIISQNTPGGNLWYGRLLASRLVFDNVQKMLDRDYAASFARQQQRAMKTNHQGVYWAPGQNAPGRGPDLGAMLQ